MTLRNLISICLGAVLLLVSSSGCGKPKEAAGPEMGSIEAYLNEHPEERVDSEDEPGSEEDEFAAGS